MPLHRFSTDSADSHVRLDVVVASHLEDTSRAQAKKWIEGGRVRVEGREISRASRPCREGEQIEVEIPPPLPAEPGPERIPLEVAFEDEHVIVVVKPAGLVVHPSPGHPSGTLVNALLAHCDDLSGIGGVERPGIVHRLDAGTSGLLVVAKHDRAHRRLSEAFQARRVEKRYLAIVHGRPPERLVLDRPIGRDPRHRKKISSRSHRARAATSELALLEVFPGSSLVSVRILTGRTHQIRVHLSEAGFAVVGDRDYGAPGPKGRLPSKDAEAARLLRGFWRPALHAAVLAFEHPETGEAMRWEAALPEDMSSLLEKLRDLRDEADG